MINKPYISQIRLGLGVSFVCWNEYIFSFVTHECLPLPGSFSEFLYQRRQFFLQELRKITDSARAEKYQISTAK